MRHERPSMAELQEVAYGADRDYTFGSPHLAHASLRSRIEGELEALVREQVREHGKCTVLEVGAGHGHFTAALLRAGGRVTVTEMSKASAALLSRTYANHPAVTVMHDREGNSGAALAANHDLVVMISVLHHIPDYVSAVRELVTPLPAKSAFYCAQDPMWYPARSFLSMTADKGAYLAWRLAQGDRTRGFARRMRRARGLYNEASASDMVEYHVVRQGVNERQLVRMLSEKFEQVDLREYWSTQSSLLQRLGDRLGLKSTFGIVATQGRPA